MRIAQIAPLAEAVPPKLYGGTERVVSYLTEELVGLGHEVTLFASGDSVTPAELVPVTPKALRLDPKVRDFTPYVCMLLDEVVRRANEFDVLHFHIEMLHFPCFRHLAARTVTTLHGRLDLPDHPPFYRTFPQYPLVSISHAQRRPMPPVNWLATIPHGLQPHLLNFNAEPDDYFAFLGRISPEKGPETAIRIAREAGVKLKIAAKVDKADRDYFEAVVKPLLKDPSIEFVGEVNERQKNEFLGNARALLFPIDWPEPFGLVMIEAMACGTPCVAFERGSVPEVLENGVTGFIVDSVGEAVEAVSRVSRLDRGRVRSRFEERFTAARMAQNYVDAFEQLLDADGALKVA
jgi:glycosyltransferase involved in cell wall biosynthesis